MCEYMSVFPHTSNIWGIKMFSIFNQPVMLNVNNTERLVVAGGIAKSVHKFRPSEEVPCNKDASQLIKSFSQASREQPTTSILMTQDGLPI